MKVKIADYKGPTGMFVATGREILPINSIAGRIALAEGAIQAGIGDQGIAEKLHTDIHAVIVDVKQRDAADGRL